MKKPLVLTLLIAVALCVTVQSAYTDTYEELKACLRGCINNHPAWSKARFNCVLDCYAKYADQKVSLNVAIGDSSTGYKDDPYLLLEEGSLVTVDIDILNGGSPDSVRLIVLEDDNNPSAPDFGVHVGTDDNGGDGWFITFDPGDYGLTGWSGAVVAEAYFPGHDLETDGDVALINATTSDFVPALTDWGTPATVLLVLLAGALLIWRRRAPALG